MKMKDAVTGQELHFHVGGAWLRSGDHGEATPVMELAAVRPDMQPLQGE